MDTLISTIAETMRASESAEREKKDVCSRRAAHREHDDAVKRAKEAFAEINGWKVKGERGAEDLSWLLPRDQRPWPYPHAYVLAGSVLWDVYDHPFACRATTRPWKMTAYVSQPYRHVKIPEAHAVAAHWGLACHVPPNPLASIYYPGQCLFLVFTKPGTSVRLPEQYA
jgi:hypothetical protein